MWPCPLFARSGSDWLPTYGGLYGGLASHGDDELSARVSFSLVSESFRNLTQLVPAIDDRRDLPGFDELLQNHQILSGCAAR